MNKNIVCLVGESGAGKGAAVEILKEYGYVAYILGNEVRHHAQESGIIAPTRAELQMFANLVRREYGTDYYMSRILQNVVNQLTNRVVIDGVRNIGELNRLREIQGVNAEINVVGIVADPNVRFSRVIQRRDNSDPLTYKEFLENDRREKGTEGDQFAQQNEECLRSADILIENNNTLSEFRRNLETKLGLNELSSVEGQKYFYRKECI